MRRHNQIIHPGERSSGELTFVGLEHIEAGTGRRLGSATLDLARMTGRKPTFRRGQIVYGYLRPYLNKVWIAEFDGCSSVDQFAFEVDGDIASSDFIAAFLRSGTFLQRAARATTTGQLPRISIEEILAVELDLPPLHEQERIASNLTAQLAHVERARHAAQDRLDGARAFTAAYLRGVFDGPAASTWPESTLGALVRTPIHTGISKPGGPQSTKRCLTLAAVRGHTLRLEASKPVDVNDSEAEGNWLLPGRFYVVRGNGNRQLVGRGAFAPDPMPEPVLFPDLLFQLDLGDQIDPFFFWGLWSSASVRAEIEERARTSAGIFKINTGHLQSLPLRLPDLPTQRRIGVDLRECLAAAERLATAAEAELALVEALPSALLSEVFNGGD